MHHNPLPWGWHPLAYCVPPYFGLAYCVPFNNKTTIFGKNFHLHRKDKMTVCCVHIYVQSFLQTLKLLCLLVRFPSFRYPQINVYVNKLRNYPPKRRSLRSSGNFFKSYLIWMSRLLWFLIKIEFFNNHFNL